MRWWPRLVGPAWLNALGAVAVLVFGVVVLFHDRITRARAEREALRRCQGHVESVRCQAGVRAHHTSCFNLTNDGGGRYRRGTGVAWDDYLECAVEGPDAHKRAYAERKRRADANRER